MPKIFLYLSLLIGVLSIFAVSSYFAIKKNDYQPQVSFVQNVSQEEKKEENNHQEEIVNLQEENINEEKNDNFNIFDNVTNIIILLLAFAIAFYFVYYSPFSLVAKNKKGSKSLLRKTVFFKGENYSERWDYFFGQETAKEAIILMSSEVSKAGNVREYEIKNFLEEKDPSNFQIRKIIIKDIKEKIPMGSENIKTLQANSDKREKHIEPFNKLKPRLIEEYSKNDPLNFDINQPSYSEYFVNFKGSFDLFNRYNIIAFLLSSLFFLASFVIPYFVLYFFFVLFSTFFFLDEKEIKENKFLIAFYRSLKALIFLNFRGLLKIIPGLLFLIILSLNGVLFFRKEIFIIKKKENFLKKILKFVFHPIVYDVSDKNAKLEERVMNIYNIHTAANHHNYADFFRIGKIKFQIDKNSPYLSS